jgi:hypothetical protein
MRSAVKRELCGSGLEPAPGSIAIADSPSQPLSDYARYDLSPPSLREIKVVWMGKFE